MIKTRPLLRQSATLRMISRFIPSLSLNNLIQRIIGIMADADSQGGLAIWRRVAQRRVASCPPPHKMGGKYLKRVFVGYLGGSQC